MLAVVLLLGVLARIEYRGGLTVTLLDAAGCIKQAEFDGSSADGRIYRLSADEACPDETASATIILTTLKIHLPEGAGALRITAQTGKLETTTDRVHLTGDVRMSDQRGNRARATRADYSLNNDKLVLQGDVRVATANGSRATATRADYSRADNQLLLQGDVSAAWVNDEGREQNFVGEQLTIDMTSGKAEISSVGRAGGARPKINLSR